jgi:alpha-beta hydrolase superfamily lysophospholipase
VRLEGWLFAGAPPARGTLVYLHGSADNRTSGLAMAERYAPRGFDVLLYDSRAHGESGGDACTYGYYEKDDLRRAIDGLRASPVAVLGVSLGGAVALQAAATDRRIAAVVAVSTFSDLRTIATERAPWFATPNEIAEAFGLAEASAHFAVDDVSPVAAAMGIRAPTLLVHGDSDRETRPSHSERIFAALRCPKRLILVPGAGHDDALRPDVWPVIDAWLDRAVPSP